MNNRENKFVKIWRYVSIMNILAFVSNIGFLMISRNEILVKFSIFFLGMSIACSLISSYLYYINRKADIAYRELNEFLESNK